MFRSGILTVKILLGIMFLGWLSAPLHMLSIQHHWCNEHGQFEHEDNSHDHTAIQRLSLSTQLPEFSSSDSKDTCCSDSHTACHLLGCLNRNKAYFHTSSIKAPFCTKSTGIIVIGKTYVTSPEPLLSFAPKQGPPSTVPSYFV